MDNLYADLHIHSCFSDGTATPQEILKEAERLNIGLLAITDHDTLQGSENLFKVNGESPVKCIPAVEITTLEKDCQVHILAYGVNLYDEKFREFISENRKKLDNMSAELIKTLEKSDSRISLAEYQKYSQEKSGGWKALHYFVFKGVTKALTEGISLYAKNGVTYEKAGFVDTEKAIGEIHKVGGKAIVAHPKVTFRENFLQGLDNLLLHGIDGVECFYPEHSKKETDILVKFCNQNNLIITCGSDCHGTFLKNQMGKPRIKTGKLRLDGIISQIKII